MSQLDIETIEHLDFTGDIPCEALGSRLGDPTWNCNGSNPAIWRVVIDCSCHGDENSVKVFCNYCFQKRINSDRLQCKACGHIADPAHTFYVRVEKFR